ncbi:peptidoglycan-binding domain-containing protein [Streptomyces sp. NPDC046261]|uniref:peptidoglycan-binding domain-containing protein n=1 Tax=Streptomyces sp. NPDC046261 TaxID=3157200 RepID=UPI0033DC49C1
MNVRKRVAAGIVSAAFVGGTMAAIAPAAQAAQPAAQESVSVSAAAKCKRTAGIGWYCGYHKGTPYTDYGDRGAKVKEVQALIKYTTAYKGKLAVDGVFGKDTLAAVKWFQKNYNGGQADGKVGPKTWKALRAK